MVALSMQPATEKAIVGLCVMALLLVLWSAAAWTPLYDWNGARLYPAYLLAAGEQLYHPAGVGVVNGWIYGPGLPLVLTPVTLIPDPTWAMFTAAWINFATLFGPLVVIMHALVGKALPMRRQMLFSLFVTALIVLVPTTFQRLVFITCDQLAIGLGVISCFILNRALQTTDRRAHWLCWLAAAVAVASVWSKQTEVVLPAAQIIFLWLRRSRRRAFGYTAELAVAFLVSLALMVSWSGWSAIWFNLVWIPSHHPLATGAQSLGPRLLRAVLYGSPLVAVATWGLRRRSAPEAMPVEEREFAGQCLLVGAALFATGVLAAAKVGGDENSFHFVYFFALAAGAAWASMLRDRFLLIDSAGPVVACAVGVVLAAWLAQGEAPARLVPAPSLNRAITFASELREHVLFPRNPLVTWITERKQYHHEWGLYDQNLAGVPLRFDHFWDGMPPQLSRVVYPMAGRYFFMQLMPDVRQEMVLPDLAVYAVGPRPAAPVFR